ncbi:MAG: hypothetical protein ACREOH_15570 [Candidatus Entotheonellia bacterium]
MAFEPRDFQELVRLLREHPEWREDLRMLLLTQELLELPAVVRELAEAVKGVADRVDRLEASQQQMAATLQGVLEVQRQLAARMGRLEDDVGDLKGSMLEQHYRTHAYAYFGRLLRRVRVLEFREVADLLEDSLPPDERAQVLLADVVLTGQFPAIPQPTELWVVVEVSSRIDRTDVQRAAQRADLLRRAGYRTVATVAGRQVTRGARSAGAGLKVAMLEDGRVEGWEAALQQALPQGGQGG